MRAATQRVQRRPPRDRQRHDFCKGPAGARSNPTSAQLKWRYICLGATAATATHDNVAGRDVSGLPQTLSPAIYVFPDNLPVLLVPTSLGHAYRSGYAVYNFSLAIIWHYRPIAPNNLSFAPNTDDRWSKTNVPSIEVVTARRFNPYLIAICDITVEQDECTEVTYTTTSIEVVTARRLEI
ncbi:hypothetical protein J6590_025066 [Homalodisca vitripennis]|nr:hypothetical protein J6590_025066 [Homalodisca vitripennis]